MTPATYSIVIPTTGDRPSLRQCVTRVLAQTRRPLEVIVVAAHPACRPAWMPPAAQFATAPPSTAGQRNLGARLASGEVVLFVDDDTLLAPDFAELLLDAWAGAGGRVVGACGVVLNDPQLSTCTNFVYFLLGLGYGAYRAPASRLRRSGHVAEVPCPRRVAEARFLHGGCAAYDRQLLVREPFDETFTGYVLGEDRDVAARMAARGRLLQVPHAVCLALDIPSTAPPDPYGIAYLHGERLSDYRWRHRGRGSPGTICWVIATVGQAMVHIGRGLRGLGWAGLRGYLAGLRVTCARIAKRECRRWRPRPDRLIAIAEPVRGSSPGLDRPRW